MTSLGPVMWKLELPDKCACSWTLQIVVSAADDRYNFSRGQLSPANTGLFQNKRTFQRQKSPGTEFGHAPNVKTKTKVLQINPGSNAVQNGCKITIL